MAHIHTHTHTHTHTGENPLHLAQNALTILFLALFLSIDSFAVPISILTDDLVEMDEDFRLALLSQADNPTTNIRLGGNIDTQVVIENENGRNVLSLVCVLGIHNVVKYY